VTIKVGFVGAGFIARYHAMQLRLAAQPSEVAGVLDIDPLRAEQFVAEEGGVVVDSLDQLLMSCDAIFVCTWTSEHLDVVRRICAAGLPVFCEKPLSTDLASARRLTKLVEGAGVVNIVGLVLRSSPALLALRELVRDPRSGRVMNVVFRDDQYLPVQGVYGSTWRADPDRAGSGVLLEHSIHDLDLLEWLFGDIEWVVARETYQHGLEGIEDSVSVLMAFRNGPTASLATVWHDVLSRPSQRRIEVFCERAVVTLEGDVFGPVRRQDSDGELVLEGDALVEWLVDRGVPLVSAEQEFLGAVFQQRQGGPHRVLAPDVHDALRAHELVDAVYRSARGGGVPVTVAPSDSAVPRPRSG
jgi:predicted dehydrogenase